MGEGAIHLVFGHQRRRSQEAVRCLGDLKLDESCPAQHGMVALGTKTFRLNADLLAVGAVYDRAVFASRFGRTRGHRPRLASRKWAVATCAMPPEGRAVLRTLVTKDLLLDLQLCKEQAAMTQIVATRCS